ncbi:hypothetical protein DL764_003582 [Monosporascus ibericus]|uniref:Nudix hydrolase domain-containing protein n=1 Tax=Monosporascus ibericus TaxID=155417 RepID=A0A4Q4TFZ1_9PEZI|nr:hypothetical protein DL764_003582 [Monosporascus ibericus]
MVDAAITAGGKVQEYLRTKARSSGRASHAKQLLEAIENAQELKCKMENVDSQVLIEEKQVAVRKGDQTAIVALVKTGEAPPKQAETMSNTEAKVLSAAPLSNEEAVWTKLVKIEYRDPKGKSRLWESAERRTRPQNSDIDGVGILAVVEKPTGPEIILQKQYRPPVDKVCVEVPAGLVDEGETAEEAAVRELKEETGYVGKVTEVTPMMFNDPGFCNTNLRMVHVTIDMNLPENQDLKPELEENEFIEVFLVPLTKLYEECKKLEAEGYAIDARVGTLAEGIEAAKQYRLRNLQSTVKFSPELRNKSNSRYPVEQEPPEIPEGTSDEEKHVEKRRDYR